MNPGAGRRQDQYPRPFRKSSLWRQCKFAMIVAPWRGHTNSPLGSCIDNQTRGMGRNLNQEFVYHGVGAPGLWLGSGPSQLCSSVWNDFVYIADNKHGIFRWEDGGGITAAILYRLTALPGSDKCLFAKRFSKINTNHGWAWYYTVTGNKFQFTWCDGITQEAIVTSFTPNANQTYWLLARHYGSGNKKVELWIDGVKDAVNGATATYPAYESDPPLYIHTDNNNAIPAGQAWVAAFWNRPLSDGEINALTTNPYVMWQPPPTPQGLGHENPVEATLPGCNCCPGWLGSFNDM